MEITDILNLDSNSTCRIEFTFVEEWDNCYYQLKQESHANINTNKLPVLNDEYLADTGEPLYNENNEEVYDPEQEIKYESSLSFEQKDVYTSKSFIKLAQNRIKDLIKSGDLSLESDNYELLMALGGVQAMDTMAEIFHSLRCNDSQIVENYNEYDSILWFTSYQLDAEDVSIWIEEI